MATAVKQPAVFIIRPAIIPAGESLSGVIDCTDMGNANVAAVIMPENYGSDVTFQVSFDNINYFDLYNMDGEAVTIAATPGAAALVDPAVAGSLRFVKLRAGTKHSPAPQDEDCEF